MKLLVFAHKPPPHHGQSYMVQLVLEAFGGDRRRTPALASDRTGDTGIELYHVNCRLSDEMSEIGRASFRKVIRLLGYCLEAIRCRWRHGVRAIFYIPGPALRPALYRDWLVMFCCRLFFRQRVYYWQASGMGAWLNSEARGWERRLTMALLGRPDLSVVLSEYGRVDADALRSRTTRVIPNAIPDPCPDFETDVFARRQSRFLARQKSSLAGDVANHGSGNAAIFRVFFLSLCTREKGLFDAMEAVRLANRRLADSGSPLQVQLNVAGKFWRPEEQPEFERLKQEAGTLRSTESRGQGEPMIRHCGFVDGAAKRRLFLESDCFCFPTYYPAESFGIVLIEAMAFGLPIIATNWRSIPELLPAGYPGIVEPRSPEQITRRILRFMTEPPDDLLRRRFLASYTIEKCMEKLRAALNELPPG